MRLSRLGWTNEEIGAVLGVTEGCIRTDRNNSNLGKITNDLGPDWNDQCVAGWAERTETNLTNAWAAIAAEVSEDKAELAKRARAKKANDVKYGRAVSLGANVAPKEVGRTNKSQVQAAKSAGVSEHKVRSGEISLAGAMR